MTDTQRKRANGQGSISYDRTKRKWRVRLSSTRSNGKVLRRGWYTDTEAEAKELLSELRGQLDAGELRFDRTEPRVAHIYFIQPVEGGPIKIGSAVNVETRFLAIQSCSPSILKVLATVPDKDALYERELHKRFAYCRLHGEWFSPVAELLELIDKFKMGPMTPMGPTVGPTHSRARGTESHTPVEDGLNTL